jgi:hypothetical protein
MIEHPSASSIKVAFAVHFLSDYCLISMYFPRFYDMNQREGILSRVGGWSYKCFSVNSTYG